MKNIKISIFCTIIITISISDISHCLAEDISHREKEFNAKINLTDDELRQAFDHGFPILIYVKHLDRGFFYTCKAHRLMIDLRVYPKAAHHVNLLLIDDHESNKHESSVQTCLIIKHNELNNTLRSAKNGVIYECIIENKDLYVGAEGDVYIFRDIYSKEGIHLPQRVIAPNDSRLQAQREADEQSYIFSAKNLERAKAEETFSQCLVSNRNNPDLGSFGIPKVCEDSGKILQILGADAQVQKLIANFKKPLSE